MIIFIKSYIFKKKRLTLAYYLKFIDRIVCYYIM